VRRCTDDTGRLVIAIIALIVWALVLGLSAGLALMAVAMAKGSSERRLIVTIATSDRGFESTGFSTWEQIG
jgi:hypothetical protein